MNHAGLPERLEGVLADRTGCIIGSGLGGSGTLIEQITINTTRGRRAMSGNSTANVASKTMYSGKMFMNAGWNDRLSARITAIWGSARNAMTPISSANIGLLVRSAVHDTCAVKMMNTKMCAT